MLGDNVYSFDGKREVENETKSNESKETKDFMMDRNDCDCAESSGFDKTVEHFPARDRHRGWEAGRGQLVGD